MQLSPYLNFNGKLRHRIQVLRKFKPRGVWLFVMHGPDGCDYQNKAVLCRNHRARTTGL
jgi:hypothetical protein